MANRTRSERETAIILSDIGTCTVWSCSPMRIRQLLRRLGAAHRTTGETHYWDISPETHSIPLPRRKGKPRKPAPNVGFQKKERPPV
jgi:hypothetical protein